MCNYAFRAAYTHPKSTNQSHIRLIIFWSGQFQSTDKAFPPFFHSQPGKTVQLFIVLSNSGRFCPRNWRQRVRRQVYLALLAISKSYRLYLYAYNNTFDLLWSRPVSNASVWLTDGCLWNWACYRFHDTACWASHIICCRRCI